MKKATCILTRIKFALVSDNAHYATESAFGSQITVFFWFCSHRGTIFYLIRIERCVSRWSYPHGRGIKAGTKRYEEVLWPIRERNSGGGISAFGDVIYVDLANREWRGAIGGNWQWFDEVARRDIPQGLIVISEGWNSGNPDENMVPLHKGRLHGVGLTNSLCARHDFTSPADNARRISDGIDGTAVAISGGIRRILTRIRRICMWEFVNFPFTMHFYSRVPVWQILYNIDWHLAVAVVSVGLKPNEFCAFQRRNTHSRISKY